MTEVIPKIITKVCKADSHSKLYFTSQADRFGETGAETAGCDGGCRGKEGGNCVLGREVYFVLKALFQYAALDFDVQECILEERSLISRLGMDCNRMSVLVWFA